MKTKNTISSFGSLMFSAMQVPNTGCIAQGSLSSGCEITVTGGNIGQQADGCKTFLVEVVDTRRKEEPRVVTKRNMSMDDLAFLIEHHRKNARNRGTYNRYRNNTYSRR